MRFLPANRRGLAPSVFSGLLAMTCGLLVALAPPATAEDSITDLGVSSNYGDLVVGGDRVAVSADDRIVIADTTGEIEGVVTGLPGVFGLAMTADGTHLYAALPGSNEVAEIDTATREITRRIDLADYPCPSSLALTGERLWVGYGGCSGDNGVLGLDMSVAEPEPSPFGNPLPVSPLIAAAGNTLVVGEGVGSPADLFVYDLSGAVPLLLGEIDGHTHGNSRLADVAVTPDGSHVISAFAVPYSFDMWDATTLTKVRGYEGPAFDGFPTAVGISSDGAYIAGARDWGTAMTLYDTASGAKVHTENIPEGEVLSGSVAFSGRDVFSVVKSPTNQLSLWRLHDVTLPSSTLTLAAAPGGTAREPLDLTGQLAFADGTTPGVRPLTVTRTLPDGTSAELSAVTTTADGTFTITDTPPVGGQITYTVRWEGGAGHRWSKASVTTAVRYGTTLTLAGPTSGVAGKTLVFTGELQAEGTTPPYRVWITVQRTRNSDGDSVEWWESINSFGSYAFEDVPDAGEYTYTVRWAGDNRTGAAQSSQVVTVHEPDE
ncbi:WD40 repeat domain-containing protein [Nonomuraea sp. C10]|uniref:WD40 repeat domain-containing protein n=1 Tax=Nonomuraea sp. C10 TaxID=2600577 RepID=UPI0011CDF8A2|nr:WD40 repeat domain-containing protein [Nonomuraea sp. C10]TXK42438.1 WD40 repeat domain-containing protein [Nonomuraea sp. C10]